MFGVIAYFSELVRVLHERFTTTLRLCRCCRTGLRETLYRMCVEILLGVYAVVLLQVFECIDLLLYCTHTSLYVCTFSVVHQCTSGAVLVYL